MVQPQEDAKQVLQSQASFRHIQGLIHPVAVESGSWAFLVEGALSAFNLCVHSPTCPVLDPWGSGCGILVAV